jgi:Tfp pilus assembly protein PilF
LGLLARGAQQLAGKAADDALRSFEQAVELAPDWAEPHYQAARAHARLLDNGQAESAARAALNCDPFHAGASHLLGTILCVHEQFAEGMTWLRLAVEQAPNVAQYQRDLATAQLFLGNVSGARAAFWEAIKSDVHADEALYSLVRMTRMDDGSAASAQLLNLLLEAAGTLDQMPVAKQIEICFALAKAHEDRGEIEPSFAAMAKANALKRATLTYSADASSRRMRSVAETFDQPLIQRLGGQGAPSDRPIFIVGMPRCGSTLVEQIISAHTQVHGAGEIPVLNNLLASARGTGGATYPKLVATMSAADCKVIGQAYLDSLPTGFPGQIRTTDKWLGNFEHLGLIHLCLPGATIIHCRRDPRDNCFSCLSLRFAEGQEYAYDMVEMGRYWRDYDALMAHWRAVLPPGRMLEVPYEALVADLDQWSRRIITHCGLDWDEACLRYYDSKRTVRSASLVQVREPIFSTSIGRWKPFERYLQPMFEVMGGGAAA